MLSTVKEALEQFYQSKVEEEPGDDEQTGDLDLEERDIEDDAAKGIPRPQGVPVTSTLTW